MSKSAKTRAEYANVILEMAFVSVPGKPGVQFQGTRDECFEWAVAYSKTSEQKAKVHYLRTIEPKE